MQTLALTPRSPEELAAALAKAAKSECTIALCGAGSKHAMAGPRFPAQISIDTLGLHKVLQYEPNDLTVSVEAGMRWADLQAMLARERQMVALDPPFAHDATVGGVVASNCSGPMRRLYGTARDLVIGMRFATLEGELVQAGGMVVKNVAGLDMSKLMIGSFGTLAAITSVNFRLHAQPEETCTFLFASPNLEAVVAKRDEALRGNLRPIALEVVSPGAAAQLGRKGHLLALRAGGSARVLARYGRELPECELLSGQFDKQFWRALREFTPEFLRPRPEAVVLRVATSLTAIDRVVRLAPGPCVVRAGTGVSYVYADSWAEALPVWQVAKEEGWSAVVEYAPNAVRQANELWLGGSMEHEAGFAIMKNVKRLFDQGNLLNRSRLYGRI